MTNHPNRSKKAKELSFAEWLIALNENQATPAPHGVSPINLKKNGWLVKTKVGWRPTRAALRTAKS